MPCARPAIFAINLANTESQAHRSCIGCGMNWCPVDIAHSPSLRKCDVQVYGYGITQRKGKKQKRKTKTRLSVFTFSTYINNCYILFSRSPPPARCSTFWFIHLHSHLYCCFMQIQSRSLLLLCSDSIAITGTPLPGRAIKCEYFFRLYMGEKSWFFQHYPATRLKRAQHSPRPCLCICLCLLTAFSIVCVGAGCNDWHRWVGAKLKISATLASDDHLSRDPSVMTSFM